MLFLVLVFLQRMNVISAESHQTNSIAIQINSFDNIMFKIDLKREFERINQPEKQSENELNQTICSQVEKEDGKNSFEH